MLLPYIATRSTTPTSVQCLSQCNHAPGSCPGAQNTVGQKQQQQQQQKHISNVTTPCMIQLHILVCCILHSLADNHIMIFIEEGMELCAQLTALSSTSPCLPNPMVPRMILSLATEAMVTCSDQETGVVHRMIIIRFNNPRTKLSHSTWQINMASNLKVVLGTMELGKRGLTEDQPVSAVCRRF